MKFLKILKDLHDKYILHQPEKASQGTVGVLKRYETAKKPSRNQLQENEWNVRRRRKYKNYALHHKKKRVRNKYINRLKREFPDTWLEIKERTKPPYGNAEGILFQGAVDV